MKILWLTPYPIYLIKEELGITVDVKGHSAGWIVNLSNELAKRENVELHILSHTKYANKYLYFIKYNIHFHIVPHKIPIIKKGYPHYLPLDVLFKYKTLIKKIKSIVKDISPDIIHAHGTEGVYALAVGKIPRIKSVVSIQGIISEIVKTQSTIKYRLQKRIEIESIKDNTNFGCRTDWDKNWIYSINNNAVIHYLPESINTVFFDVEWKGYNKKNILFVGSIIQRKGVEVLLAAFRIVLTKIPEACLRLVGSGSFDYLKKIEKIISSNGMGDNIQLLGYQSPTNVAELLRETTIFVLPTIMDNSPNSLAEAMAAGVPSIATNVGGIPSMIRDNETGLLFKLNDEYDLADKIVNLLQNNELQAKLSVNSKTIALQRNLPKFVCNATLNVYEKIMSTL